MLWVIDKGYPYKKESKLLNGWHYVWAGMKIVIDKNVGDKVDGQDCIFRIQDHKRCPVCEEVKKAAPSPFLSFNIDHFVWEHWCFACFAVWIVRLSAIAHFEMCPDCGEEYTFGPGALELSKNDQNSWIFRGEGQCWACEAKPILAYRPLGVEIIHQGGHGSPLYSM